MQILQLPSALGGSSKKENSKETVRCVCVIQKNQYSEKYENVSWLRIRQRAGKKQNDRKSNRWSMCRSSRSSSAGRCGASGAASAARRSRPDENETRPGSGSTAVRCLFFSRRRVGLRRRGALIGGSTVHTWATMVTLGKSKSPTPTTQPTPSQNFRCGQSSG